MGIDVTSASSSNNDHHSVDGARATAVQVAGLFVFYIAHDALQERMFRYQGFEFGFFMTLTEVIVMLVGSVTGGEVTGLLATGRGSKRRRLPVDVLMKIALVGTFLALAHGLGNTSLKYSPYPLKVAFKSCKLVPTMMLGACVNRRSFTAMQYTAALVMGSGLATLTAANVFDSKSNRPLEQHTEDWHQELGHFIGPILLTVSTIFDSIIPNLQENLLQSAKVSTSELIFVSNSVMWVVLVGYTAYSGELVLAWRYCLTHRDASFVLLVQGICAYFGLKCYLRIIQDQGGVVGVLAANMRKVCTIILSFLLFSKPFNERHFIGLVLVFVGVYLGFISKNKAKSKSVRRKAERSEV